MRSLPRTGESIIMRRRAWRVVQASREPGVVRLDLADAEGERTFLLPFDRITARARPHAVRVRRASALARLSAERALVTSWNAVRAALTARIDLHAYQLEPCLALFGGHRRVLLADAVGLGKTVQAGLAAAELIGRAPASRILIVTPAGLVDQWVEELRTRFSLVVRRATPDSVERAAPIVRLGYSPWQTANIWIASVDYLKQPHVVGTMPLEPWDLLIVDEAHSVCGQTDRHAAVLRLARRARYFMALTATPHAGDEAAFTRLTHLGALPGIDHDLVILRRTRREAGLETTRRIRWRAIRAAPPAEMVFDALDRFDARTGEVKDPSRRALGRLLAVLLRRRATSTLSALLVSLERRLEWLDRRSDVTVDWVQPSLDFVDRDDELAEHERLVLAADTGLPEHVERRHLDHIVDLVRLGLASDPKVGYLGRLLARTREPVVVFSEFRDSIDALATHLGAVRPIAVIHGGLGEAARRSALASFLGGESTALLATDVAGQGLNLQARCRWVINLDLPWSPARLEQRIGRVDRIGQRAVVHATLLTLARERRARTDEVLLARIEAARSVMGRGTFAGFGPGEASEPATAPETLRESRVVARRSRACERLLARLRARQRRWQAPPSATGRPWSTGPLAKRTAAGRTWLGYHTAVVDALGTVLEPHAVVVAIPARVNPRALPAELLSAVTALIGRRLEPRCRRVAGWHRVRADREAAAERSIARGLVAEAAARNVQLSLYTRQPERTADSALTAAASIGEQAERRIGLARGRSAVGIGLLHLAWIWTK